MTSDELKRNVSMREIVEQYGIKIDRKGFCWCPFHKEKTGSMKIYKNSYYCFGCGESGDIFTFVQKMDDVDFKTAFKRLGGTYNDESDYRHKLFRYRMEKQKETEKARLQREAEEKRQIIQEIKLQKLFIRLFPVFDDDWCSAINRLEYLYYRLALLTEKR